MSKKIIDVRSFFRGKRRRSKVVAVIEDARKILGIAPQEGRMRLIIRRTSQTNVDPIAQAVPLIADDLPRDETDETPSP